MKTNAWAAERGIWGLHHMLSITCHLEGLFTATRTVLESSTLLHEDVLTASSWLFCMFSVIVTKDAIMLSQPPLPLPREPHEESIKTPCLQITDHSWELLTSSLSYPVTFFQALIQFLVLLSAWKCEKFGSTSPPMTIILLKHFRFVDIRQHESFINSSQFNKHALRAY